MNPVAAAPLEARLGLLERAEARFDSLASWRYRDPLLLGLLVLAVAGLNLLWVSLEPRPPHWDKARHLETSLHYRDLFTSGHPFHVLTAYYIYPPLVYSVTDLFYAVFGSTAVWVAVLSQVPFLAVLVFSTYGTGARLWSRRVGLLAALVVVTSPMIASQFKDYMLDAPLTAMVALALYLLIRTDAFSRRNASLLFGTACGLGLLTKWNFALYITLPVLVALFLAARASLDSRSLRRLGNVGAAGLLAFAVAGIWYVDNFSKFVHDTTRGQATAARIEGDPPVVSSQSFLWHLWNLVTNQLYLVPFLLFVAGVVFLVRKREALRRNWYPAVLIAGSYAAATLIENKDDRYTMPMLSAVAVVAVYWLDSLRARPRRWLVAGTVTYSVVTFLALSFGIGFLPKDVFLHLGPRALVSGTQSFTPEGEIVTLRGLRVWSQNGYIDGPPSGEHWYQEEMFREAASASPNRTLWFVSPNNDFIWFNYFAMQYYSVTYGVTWVAAPEQAGLAGVRTAPGQDQPAPNGFVEARRFALPDGGTLRLYRHSSTTGSTTNGPVAVTIDDLRQLASRLGQPIYWAGPRGGFTYELTQAPNRRLFIRYLPPDAKVGEQRPFLTVATYPVANAYAVTRTAGSGEDAVRLKIGNGGFAFYSRLRPANVYLAYQGSDFQVEVFAPSPTLAHRLVVSRSVRPVR